MLSIVWGWYECENCCILLSEIAISFVLLSENHYLIYTLIRVSPFPYTPFLKSPPSSHHFPETRAVTAEKCGNRNPVDYVRGTHRIPANADVT